MVGMASLKLAPLSVGLLLLWSLLVALQLGWLPTERIGWAFNLWAYLPGWAAVLLGTLSLLLCAARVRSAVEAGFAALTRRLPKGERFEALACCFVALALWVARESVLTGDSGVLAVAASTRHEFVFPEVGATFLLRSIVRIALALGVDQIEMMRAFACACGGMAIWLMLRVAREIAPGASASAITLLLFSGGLARVFAGRIEVYPPLLVAVLAYMWCALRALRGDGHPVLPALCLGIAIWLHAAAMLLVPSLLAIPLLAARRPTIRDAWREAIRASLIAGAPLAGFLVVQSLVAGTAEFMGAWTRVLEILGRSNEPGRIRWWVRGWAGAPSIGTDVVWLSRPHLKYLLNAFSLMVPAVLPCLLFLLLRRPRVLVAGVQGQWIALMALPLGLYATAVRPFFGPWDWDLFALPALVIACLCVRAVASLPLAPGLAVACIGFQLCFVGVPFLWIGAGNPRDVGPFGFEGFDYDLRQPARPPQERLAPWL